MRFLISTSCLCARRRFASVGTRLRVEAIPSACKFKVELDAIRPLSLNSTQQRFLGHGRPLCSSRCQRRCDDFVYVGQMRSVRGSLRPAYGFDPAHHVGLRGGLISSPTVLRMPETGGGLSGAATPERTVVHRPKTRDALCDDFQLQRLPTQGLTPRRCDYRQDRELALTSSIMAVSVISISSRPGSTSCVARDCEIRDSKGG
jgi:hypothetical protein